MGPLRYLGTGVDHEGERVVWGGLWTQCSSLGKGNLRVGPAGRFVKGSTPLTLSLEGGGVPMSQFGRGDDPSGQNVYRTGSMDLNPSQVTGDLNKMGPGPLGGATWGVPGSQSVLAVAGNGQLQGRLANWAIGNPRGSD